MASDDVAPVVRKLVDPPEEQVERVVDLLLRVFDGDNAMESFSGQDKAIERLIYTLTIRKTLQSGECYVARSPRSSEIYGVATWLAPGIDWDFHNDPTFLAALDPALREWYNEHYASKYNELHRCLDVPKNEKGTWTLTFLAVAPESRRKGVGRALVDVISKKALSNNQSIILDVRDPTVVQFFQRLGFKYRCVKNVVSRGSPGFPIWRMYKDPSSTAASR
ncbi:hypothetical protein EIP91_009795 [Steccherinum ochraceum]|uniref:N-acetyltransferase domain-containing protein n=1 Tax=Steccherinum ochraceum TaxID=92696 RepID=A0A4R0RNJ7_9APHY|nr:hypothetical protein EIP91_009795 [Steccherinum ochraceum]